MALPTDYAERVYAGVLGKIIGVYLGRPFEGSPYERIMTELGEINYYVHEKRLLRHIAQEHGDDYHHIHPTDHLPLVVTDDDITGTFTFLRALPDYGNTCDVTAQQIGQTWLNYLIENRTILWWGGVGNSTEHTAYHRLKNGIPAPSSGSMALNGKIVAEQIGAQIFIDGWAMVCPGDPEQAANLAQKAASVSHDGEAIYGAQVIAAMEAQAFVEPDLNRLLDTALALIPGSSVIYRVINDIRAWHAKEPDWRKTRENVVRHYGYDKYAGVCHMVPNHALIIMSLLYGNDDFQKSLMIVNTSGWDTDCNAGNVGCLLGIKNGLAALDSGPDWRGPVADRLYMPTADGGRAISDAATEAVHVANIGRALYGQQPLLYKQGARFHFEMPGSVQGFRAEDDVESRGTVTLENVSGHSRLGKRSLALHYQHAALGRAARVSTSTFILPEDFSMPGYALLASPTLYPGQIVQAAVLADAGNSDPITCRLYLNVYNASDTLTRVYGPEAVLEPAGAYEFSWKIEDTDSQPIARIGLELGSMQRTSGTVYLDQLTWAGTPDTTFTRPRDPGKLWRRAWVNGADHFDPHWPEPFRVIQDNGTGLLMQGAREWANYLVTSTLSISMAKTAGIAACVQGMRRYYALLLCDDQTLRLVKALDGLTVLAEQPFEWQLNQPYALSLQVEGNLIEARVDGHLMFKLADSHNRLHSGAIAYICEEGCLSSEAMSIAPLQ